MIKRITFLCLCLTFSYMTTHASEATPAFYGKSTSACAPTSAPSASLLNTPQIMPDMTAIGVNELKGMRELQAYDERKINDPANDQLLTDEHFAKQFSADPRYQEFQANQLELVLATENLIKGPTGYTILLDAVRKKDDSLVKQLVDAILREIFNATNDVKKQHALREALSASFNGLNAYQYAAYLAKKDPSRSRLHIKLILRDILAADLPIDVRMIHNSISWEKIFQQNPQLNHNTAILVEYTSERFIVNRFILDYIDPFDSLKRLGRQTNVRFLLFFNFAFLNYSKCNDIKRLLVFAIEQGEPISNIQEIITYYLGIKRQKPSIITCLIALQKFLDKLEFENAKPYLTMIPDDVYEKVLAASSDPKVRAFKEAIDNYYLETIADDSKSNNATIQKLNETADKLRDALGNSLDNIDLTDDAGYNPLLYAVKINNKRAVRSIIVHVKVNQSQQKRNLKAVEELDTQLKEIKEQITKLAQSPKDQKAKDEVAKELKDKEKKLEEELVGLNKKLQINERVVKSLERKVNGLNAYCLAKYLGHKEIMDLLAPLFKDECLK